MVLLQLLLLTCQQQVFPVVVKENNDELNTLSVSYGNLVGVLIEAIKELKEEIEKLKKDS